MSTEHVDRFIQDLYEEDETAAIALEQITLQGVNSKDTADIMARFFGLQFEVYPVQEQLRHDRIQEHYNDLYGNGDA